MDLRLQETTCSSVAALVGPEDLRPGDFVAVMSEIVQLPSFLWEATLPSGREELVRVSLLPTEDRVPLKIKAICLPFVFVKKPDGKFATLDVRLQKLVRLERSYAKIAWKKLKPPGLPRKRIL
jgi:hypothetical protein